MAISYINTVEVESISKEIETYAKEYEDLINSLFLKYSEVPTITKEWVGRQADFYFQKALEDKKQYIEFANKLKELSLKIKSDSLEIESCMNKNLEEESKAGR